MEPNNSIFKLICQPPFQNFYFFTFYACANSPSFSHCILHPVFSGVIPTLNQEQDFMNHFTFIDLFCGIGGFRIAMESIGGICVFSSDKSRLARKTYEANFHETPKGDITKITPEDIPAFDVLCAGFPCQPFSISGKKQGFLDKHGRGTMFFEIARIAEFHKPKVLFLENVANLIKHDNGNTMKVILDILENLGYEVHYKILKANDYGVAQIRKRIYIVGFRKDLKAAFSFPEPTYEDVAIEDFLETKVDENNFIDIESVTFYKPDITHRTLSTYRMGYIGIPGQGRRVYSIKGSSPTFVHSDRGYAGSCTELYYINGRVRRFTPYEAKRILGFPKEFIFPVKDQTALAQLGNSVAIPVLEKIAAQILKTEVLTKEEPSLIRQKNIYD